VAARDGPAGVALMLAARGLAFGYRDRMVGMGLSLALNAGEVFCLLGPNGSGKTTLLKTLLGLIPPRAGSVRFGGEDIAQWPRRRAAQTLAYVPQAHEAMFPYTARDIVLMGRTWRLGLFEAPSAADNAAAEAALESLGIAAFADRTYTELSGGERQLVLVARALAQEPQVLMLDEPTASLDLANQMRVLDRIGTLARSGLAVLFTSHDPNQAFLCARRVGLMRDGMLLAVGAPEDTITAASLFHVYGVEAAVLSVPELGRNVVSPSIAQPQERRWP
jgi:iron complex transport system ATP-binding protein